jgi:hypothetical protein
MQIRIGPAWAIALLASLAACGSDPESVQTQPPVATPPATAGAITIDADDIAGVVTSAHGPEAGVWVIAETEDLGTRFSRSVVTDDAGRYLIPDLPAANYTVWVRGYGLADSARVAAEPGQHVDLNASVAPDDATAAKVYPAAYWYAMMKVPGTDELATIPGGLDYYLAWMKNLGCASCHQLGNEATRSFPPAFRDLESSQAAWVRRTQSGQAANIMIRQAASQLQGLPYKYLAEWTDRVAAGELPAEQPQRPAGLERNIVATVRDWSKPTGYMHDLTGTDRRNPTVNGYGKLYGAPELSTDEFPILDPVANTATHFLAPVRDADTPSAKNLPVVQPSAYWGEEPIWDSRANAHNPMLDQDGRVWYTVRIRRPETPAFCREGSDHPSARLFPVLHNERQLAYYDPTTGNYEFVDTCFNTHHLLFDDDENNTLWTSGGGDVIGWVNTKRLFETGDAQGSIGWTAWVLDTNGNGQRDAYTEPDQPLDPALDRRILGGGAINGYGYYAVMPSPVDDSVWGSNTGVPGAIVRMSPGDNPPATALVEKFNVPAPGFGVRGADIDGYGVVWVALGSGHLGEFDRRKCQGPLNGPLATGDHCPEGWTFHPLPGPAFSNHPGFSVESSYYAWVDQHDTLGLGADVPIATGNLFDGVHALVDGQFVTLRIPYPLGFFTKGFEGRIDDPAAGWKGRGLWVPSGDRTPWHTEDGVGRNPLVVHFQVRPDPLAR